MFFFDGSCKVCTKEVSFYNKHDKKNKFNWIDLNSKNKDLQKLGINKKTFEIVAYSIT